MSGLFIVACWRGAFANLLLISFASHSGGFLPGAGPLDHLTPPLPGNTRHLRVETGVRQGDAVSVHYDPMIAKLVVWGETRAQALDSLVARLRDYHIAGVETNVNFLLALAGHAAFRAGDVHTGYIEQHEAELFPPLAADERVLCETAVAVLLGERGQQQQESTTTAAGSNPFVVERDFRVNRVPERTIRLRCAGAEHAVTVRAVPADATAAAGDESSWQMRTSLAAEDSGWRSVTARRLPADGRRTTVQCSVDGAVGSFSAVLAADGRSVAHFGEAGKTEVGLTEPRFVGQLRGGGAGDASAAASASQVVSPMPGVLDKVLVRAGDRVAAGEPVAVIIAMKMEHVMRAPRDGVVATVAGGAGANVAKGEAVVTFEVEEAEEAAQKVAERA